MKCDDKLNLLEENLTKRLGLNYNKSEDYSNDYVYAYFTEGKEAIYVHRVIKYIESSPVTASYNKNWTLSDWKLFRDMCLQQLR